MRTGYVNNVFTDLYGKVAILLQVESLNTDFIVPMEMKLKEERKNMLVWLLLF